MLDREVAKDMLDKIIKKSRVHLYKPIQIAEILYHDRIYRDIDLAKLEDYRTKSKKWRDDICLLLLGRICTSSSKFQDNLFNENAIPPNILKILGDENKKTNGAVEAYIYKHFYNKHMQLDNALKYCITSTNENFDIKRFINLFWNEPGLRRSIDKIYEIVVYALFSTLVEELNLKVEISIDETKLDILSEFQDFARKIMNINPSHPSHILKARIYRVGVTNAADRGLDMYSNWGPAIQIKHLTLDMELAQNIVSNVSSDKVVIVCKDADKDVILSILKQINWSYHIQGIVTENDLVMWYEKALRGKYAQVLGNKVLKSLCEEIYHEFPSIGSIPESLKKRKYDEIDDPFWKYQGMYFREA